MRRVAIQFRTEAYCLSGQTVGPPTAIRDKHMQTATQATNLALIKTEGTKGLTIDRYVWFRLLSRGCALQMFCQDCGKSLTVGRRGRE